MKTKNKIYIWRRATQSACEIEIQREEEIERQKEKKMIKIRFSFLQKI